MFLWLKTLYRKRAVTWPFIFYTIIWTLSNSQEGILLKSKEYISIGDYSHNTKFVWNLCDTAIPK
ncbi:hypothetical protein CKY07_14405 [Enterococcus faecium]|nr:hypothetical protein CKY07_14405 [Enterococcus faecium]